MRKLLLPCMLTALLAAVALPMMAAGRSKTVLVIYSNERSLPANVLVDENLRDTLGASTSSDLKYQTEFLDYPHFGDETDEAYDKLISDFFRAKYAGLSPDVVIAGGPQAFRFLRRHQNDLFPNIPVLVIAVEPPSAADLAASPHFLWIPISIDPRPTLELAVRLQPRAGEIVVVSGASKFDLDWEQRIKAAFVGWTAHPPVRYLSGLSLD